MSLSVWVLLNFLEAKGICLFLTRYLVKPLNKCCQQSKAKKKAPWVTSLFFCVQKLGLTKMLRRTLFFSQSKTRQIKLTTTEVKPWIMSNCGGSALAFTYVSFVPHDLTWLELTLRHASTSRHFTSGNYVLSLFYSSLKTPKQTSWDQFVDFYE